MAENNAKAPEQESNFKALVLPVIVLVVICLVCSALLAVLVNGCVQRGSGCQGVH